MSSSFVDKLPIRIGTPEEFARLRTVLNDAQFDEETICRIFKLKDMSGLGTVAEEWGAHPSSLGGKSILDRFDFSSVSSQFLLLARLFFSPSLVPRSEVEGALDKATIDAFLSLGVLGTDEFGADDFYATVLLYPVAGFFVVSDRHSMPDGSRFYPPPDIVFPAIFVGTLHFLRLLPRWYAEDSLDLCSGTGIGALALSQVSERATSTDVTERATQFARFNCALNGCENVEVIQGDLYGAVEGRMFDRIVAHPPYVPSFGISTIWRDGGTTGELLVRRIIEGLPEQLRAGGIFFILTQGLDTTEGRFEERARSWLKDRADEFDVVFACAEEREPEGVLRSILRKDPTGDSEILHKFETEFERAGILKMPYGGLFMRRATNVANRTPWTVRKRLNEETSGSDIEAAFLLHDRLSQPDFIANLVEAKPQLAPRLEVKVRNVVHEGSLVPAEFLFEVDKPFEARGKFDAWMVPMLARLDGETTLARIYQDARSKSEMPENFRLEDFATLVARTIGAGYTVLPDDR